MQYFGIADCNNFYCSCERVFRPDLRERPVVVLSNNDGCIIARSEEAKALGIAMGTPFYQAKAMLETHGAAVFSSNYTLYGSMSARVMSLLSQYTPKLQIYSIDEAFLLLSDDHNHHLKQEGEQMAARIYKSTGIPISVGIAPTKTLAKMASHFAKHYKGYNHCCLIDNDEKRKKALKGHRQADTAPTGIPRHSHCCRLCRQERELGAQQIQCHYPAHLERAERHQLHRCGRPALEKVHLYQP